ncbi:MAG: phosphoglycerate kinase [Candidatus Doudnabacteria bacterium]|nr:phosphoglycerate kinase [Candidatus Doudnabacteria bacterium]
MIKPITSVKLRGRRVLLRVGFDVPLEKNKSGEFLVADDTRIRSSLSTINYLIEQGAKIIIISHLGRPEGEWQRDKSLQPAAIKLAELMGRKFVQINNQLPSYKIPKHIFFLKEDITVTDYTKLTQTLADGDILFLENLRFYSGEENNDLSFVRNLAKYGDIFVNDAFSVAHRKSASTYGIAQQLPSYAGVTLMDEITALNKAVKNPKTPLIIIIGGAKISDKIDTINFLAKKAEKILVGGAIANSFLKAQGYEIGSSKAAEIPLAKELLRHYKDKIVLPADLVVAKYEDSPSRAAVPEKVRPDEYIFDIGPQTVKQFARYIKTAKTLIWNGPLGMFEKRKFAFGSLAIAQVFASRTKGKAYGVVGGGESLEVIAQAKVGEFIDHISTGGGAMLEYMSGKILPAIKVLDQ